MVENMIKLTEGRKKVLEVFFIRPKEEMHLRDIVRKSSVALSATHKYLNEFVDNNFLQTRKIGKMKFFKLALENKQLLKLFENFEVDKLARFKERNTTTWKIVNEFTEKLSEEIEEGLLMLILFGSSAREEAKKTSDIDLLIVVPDKTKNKLMSQVEKISKQVYSYGREISPITIERTDFREGLKTDKDFFKTLWEDRIIFCGESIFWSEVAKL